MNRLIDSTALATPSLITKGMFLKKEAPLDKAAAEAALAVLHKELGDITGLLTKNRAETEQQYKDLTNHFGTVKADGDELKATVLKHAQDYAELVAKQQAMVATVDQIKREMDAPLLKGGTDLIESDKKAGVECQRRAHLFKGGSEEDFKPDMENLIDASAYRSAANKLVKHVGIESKNKVLRMLTEPERKAFDISSLDSAFFSPELLGIELNCIIECAELTDLYGSVTVAKSQFMYPQVMDYGAIGKYDCDAKCDAEYGPEGNIQFKSGSVSDFRGVFCFHRKTLAEANYPLLDFMFRAAARSYRINRNRALMVGDGVNEPLGWVTADCFTKLTTTTPTKFNHIDFRLFYASAPVEYGPVTAVMHQNVFAYLASQVDSNGRFIFGDGLMTYSPSDVRERIRISNCLPDATAGLTKGSTANPFTAGDFLVAAGSWAQAYYVVNKRPLWMEQWEGQSTAWCVKYVFGAEDGGFTACCPAARVLSVG
jgi:hypothetical protein